MLTPSAWSDGGRATQACSPTGLTCGLGRRGSTQAHTVHHHMSKPAWTDLEIETLMQLCGDIPRCRIFSAYNAWASGHGYPARSQKALHIKAHRLGLSLRAIGAWLTNKAIADILGISMKTVESWARRYPDYPKRKVDQRMPCGYTKRSELVKWASRHPHLFGGIDRDRLFMLLENDTVVDSIVKQYPFRPATTPIKCLDTGKVWPSMRAAANELYVVRATIHDAIRHDHLVAGRRLVRLLPKRAHSIPKPTNAA